MSIITHIRKSVRSHIAGARAAQMTAPGENLVFAPTAATAVGATNTQPSASRKPGKKPKRPAEDATAIGDQDHTHGILAPSDAKPNIQATQTTPAAHTVCAATVKARKSDLVLDLLNRDAGASMADLMAATQWQAHSVRAFLSSVIRKKLQHQVITEKEKDGARRYRLVRDADRDDDAVDKVGEAALVSDANAAAPKTAAAKTATAKAVQDAATIKAV
ncbi:DUF3489 domain-containing protein [Rhizobium sp. FKL33]|uniref:DUF3489 domain-containing protein n=1 Tax=Rhizobium sp. FKL33 TaxID=2562307 RepID=UPI001484D97A|nr:DUF3489 domain-containing protein [Rhizobium sp. FKL33]